MSSTPNGSSSSRTCGSTASALRQRHALALTTGELRWVALGELLQVHNPKQFVRQNCTSRFGHLPISSPEGIVASNGHVLEHHVVLEDEPNVGQV